MSNVLNPDAPSVRVPGVTNVNDGGVTFTTDIPSNPYDVGTVNFVDPNINSALENPNAKKHLSEIVEANRTAAYPTQIVNLPSRGLLYPEDNPLSLGYVEMKFMTAKEEDILTTESYINQGVVLDKLFQSLIVSKIDYDTLLVGDRDAIMIAARIYGYGETYETSLTTPSGETQKVTVDLKEIPHKPFDETMCIRGTNSFTYKTSSGDEIRFHLLTTSDQVQINKFLKKPKHGDQRDTQLTTRLFYMIDAVNGNDDKKFIKMFIENDFRAIDSRKFREHIAKIQPGIDMEIEVVDEATGIPFRAQIAIGLDFFWFNV
jgi:hypothetical protein